MTAPSRLPGPADLGTPAKDNNFDGMVVAPDAQGTL